MNIFKARVIVYLLLLKPEKTIKLRPLIYCLTRYLILPNNTPFYIGNSLDISQYLLEFLLISINKTYNNITLAVNRSRYIPYVISIFLQNDSCYFVRFSFIRYDFNLNETFNIFIQRMLYPSRLNTSSKIEYKNLVPKNRLVHN